jgi:MFS family permease
VLADRGFRRIFVAGCALSIATISDAFLYLVVQQQAGFSIGWFPLLFVGTSLSYLVLAVPFGRLADRVGRARVFLAGHVVLVLVYVAVLGPELRPWMLVLLLAAYGAYYAATDGVLMALVAPVLPASEQSTGFGALATGTSLSRFAGSVLFGLLWTGVGSTSAVTVYLAALVGALGLGWVLLRGGDRTPSVEVAA